MNPVSNDMENQREMFPDLAAGCPEAPTEWGATDCPCWSVRSSSSQTHRKGRPVGYRHELLFGKEVKDTGRGADTFRTFKAQAAFLNARGIVP